MRRLTEERYRSYEYRGVAWRGEALPKNSNTKTLWECLICGYRWKTGHSNIQQGTGCPRCAGCARITEEQYHELAERRDFRFIGPMPKSVSTKSTWECSAGHRWETRYADVPKYGCPYCAGVVKKTEVDYHLLAEQSGFRFIGEVPSSSRIKTDWECKHGHRWKTTYHSVSQQHGCPYCSGHVKKTEEDYKEIAKKYGFMWLGPLPDNVTMGVSMWECKHGHRWSTTYNKVQQGRGCHHCAGNRRKTEDDYHAIAKQRGYKFVGEWPKVVAAVTTWECKHGHRFEMRYNSIQQGQGCPRCASVINGKLASKAQVKIANLLLAEVNYKVGSCYVDCALPGSRIALEYDSWFWHAYKSQEDYERAMRLVEQGWRVLSIKANTVLPTHEQLNEAIAQLDTYPYIELVLRDWGKGPTRKEAFG